MEIPRLELEDPKLAKRVVDLVAPLVITAQKQEKMIEVLERELDLGLQHGLSGSGSIQMENTFIPCLLDGSESGKYLALDLGGTNFRVLLITLEKGRMVDEIISYYTVAEPLRLGPGENLFHFLAECILDFLTVQKLTSSQKFNLGFTFSFPMTQQGLDVGLLVNWTKSFNCPGVVGKDVVGMLNKSLAEVGVTNVKVVAIINDTTGTLVAGSHDYPDTAIGLILGTGTNGSYMEKAHRIVRWEERESKESCIIDPEFGAWGDNGCLDFLKTCWDKELDESSLLPGSFTYEKYFAGRYLGELARRVLVGVLEGLDRAVPPSLSSPDSLTTAQLSEIVASSLPEGQKALVLENLEEEVGAILIHICLLLSERAALMVAVPMATFLNRMARPSTTIAVTGSLYRLHPTLASRLDHHTKTLSQHPFCYRLCDDGSGKGAGLVAAIATRLHAAETS